MVSKAWNPVGSRNIPVNHARIRTPAFAAVSLVVLAGCPTESPEADGGGDTSNGIVTITASGTSATDTEPTGTATLADSSTGTATIADSSSGDGTTASASDGTTNDASASGTTSESETDGDESDTGCEETGGFAVVDFSYIWIANSTQGTVSKIDTQSATEVGRYLVDDYEGATIGTCQGPSRTSVSLDGDVAVLDRGGGLAKFIADPELCPDVDGDGTVETASDAGYLPWGTDECLAWQIDVPHAGGNCDGPRAVQWTAPEALDACTLDDPRVWVAFCNADDDDVTVWLVNGADGTVEAEIAVENYNCATYGPYGGVVDADNNFWFVDRSAGQALYRVEYGCTPVNPGDCWESFARPAGEDAYGITIDASGRIWMAGGSNSLYSFDPATLTYSSLQPQLDAFFANDAPADSNTNNTLRGLTSDENGVLWIATIANGAFSGGANPGLLRVDPDTDPVEIDFYGPSILGGIEHAAGTSIDVDGYVWLVDTLGDQAFKIDPQMPEAHEVVGGLQYPYTYSDMTGFALTQIVPG